MRSFRRVGQNFGMRTRKRTDLQAGTQTRRRAGGHAWVRTSWRAGGEGDGHAGELADTGTHWQLCGQAGTQRRW